MMLAIAFAVLLQPAAPANGITRTVVTTTPTLEAARIEYRPGASEPPGNHGYDEVLVPITGGMTAEVDGVPAAWEPGVPILVSRGAPHRIENHSSHVVRFFEVRTVGDAPASTNQTTAAKEATLVRSVFDTYVRATVWRVKPGGTLEWPADTDQVLIVRRVQDPYTTTERTPPAEMEVRSERTLTNRSGYEEEAVRISRTASR